MNNKGFTITELLVALAISGLVLASVYSVFFSQQKSYAAQSEISGMQANIRAAMFFLEKDLRLAGCNPTGTADVGIQEPLLSDSLQLTMDITDDLDSGNADGDADDTNENITYSLGDDDGDGDNDLLRNGDMIAENVDALNFRYLDDTGTETATASKVRSIQISIVAKTGKGDLGFVNNQSYTNINNDVIFEVDPPDNFRRRCLTSEIQCRNLWW